MSLESTPEFEIRKSNLKKREGFQYDVIPKNQDVPTGHIEVLFTSVDFCIHDSRYGPLKKQGLEDTDKIANLIEFYPYEENLSIIPKTDKTPETYIGEGIESPILEEVIKDSLENGCGAIITLTGRGPMKLFLKNNQFISTDRNQQEYYSIIKSGSI